MEQDCYWWISAKRKVLWLLGMLPKRSGDMVITLWDLEKKRRVERHPSLKWQMAWSSSKLDSLGFMHLGWIEIEKKGPRVKLAISLFFQPFFIGPAWLQIDSSCQSWSFKVRASPTDLLRMLWSKWYLHFPRGCSGGFSTHEHYLWNRLPGGETQWHSLRLERDLSWLPGLQKICHTVLLARHCLMWRICWDSGSVLVRVIAVGL